MIVTRIRAFGIIVILAPSVRRRPQTLCRLRATDAWTLEADRPR